MAKELRTYELKIDLKSRTEYMVFHSEFAVKWFCKTKLKNAPNVEYYLAMDIDTGEIIHCKDDDCK